tara:strand:- start:345 stop:1067 length:723 start_codon:yes stop_codon:yes gene_type:complete
MFPTRRITTSGGDVFRDEYSLAFDGGDEYVDCGNTNNLGTADFSIIMWVKSSDLTTNYFISKREDDNNRWYIRGDGNDKIQFYSKTSGSTILDFKTDTAWTSLENTWIHIAVTANRSGEEQKIYINGVLDRTDDDDSATTLNNDGNLYIGRFHSGYSNSTMSEIAIYTSALSASQVATLYNGREPYNHKEGIVSGNLTAWWRMGDGLENHSGTTIYDMSDNTNNGTMTNMDAENFKGDTP